MPLERLDLIKSILLSLVKGCKVLLWHVGVSARVGRFETHRGSHPYPDNHTGAVTTLEFTLDRHQV